MAKKDPSQPKKPGRIHQIRESYRITKQGDPNIGFILLGVFLVSTAVVFAVALWLFNTLWSAIPLGIMTGILITLIVFGRRAQTSAFNQLEGKPGAAAAALSMLRRGWKVEPAIAVNKQQDVITRVVGPPGIVLIGEGNINRLRPMLANERRKHQRVASEVPVHEMIVGNHDGEVPIRKLSRQVTKLGRSIKPAEMTDVLSRLQALDAQRGVVPLPKGPVPTSMKGMRGNMRGR
ncbi:MAG TPA: DUF4191 domain-containing protein [Marmoricola sp.]|nr:DUF4191 domain-containing protein [Marmoricola sp.]HNI71563.1 DUF4191 domain-containing protein [Marmoricola sp.]HNJ78132.1 DUF4191 domain-containing protein [Marmoricola sp.]HNN49163.1 DUF4191 domain-containing protein [Marmoricola sp.]